MGHSSNALASPSTLGYTACSMTCSGNTAEICGGPSLISIFNNTAYVYPSNPQTVGSYTYLACYHEGTTGRLLSGPSYTNSTGMTVESCTSFCHSNMPNGVYAGVEYGQGLFSSLEIWQRQADSQIECYCSATLPTTAVIQAPGTCSMVITTLYLWEWNSANVLVSCAKATTKNFVAGVACWMSMNIKLPWGSPEDVLVIFKHG